MAFSSLTFLSIALPLAVGVYYLLPRKARNYWLLAFSLAFYAWSEARNVFLMMGCILFSWAGTLYMSGKAGASRKRIAALLVTANLGVLIAFKYLDMLVGFFNAVTGLSVPAPNIPLPIGVSFFTFQIISHVLDVYRRDALPQRRLDRLALYISFFPQLIAGPIVRYADVSEQITNRAETIDGFSKGVTRFCAGLGKKVLLANELALLADEAFSKCGSLSAGGAWLGILCYAMQIYFDFSGYSDMALGLGGMFGFRFPANFNYPYCAKSIREFWNRWHMTLSGWFRDYVYIPMGGSRVSRDRRVLNIMTVFLLTGLWHGAGATFIFWGVYHGILRCGETALPERLKKGFVGWALTFAAVLLGWVLFRADDLHAARKYYAALFGFGGYARLYAFTPKAALVLALSLVGATDFPKRLSTRFPAWLKGALALITALLCLLALASRAYNPFIYFRF